MSKVSMKVKVDPYVIDQFMKVIDQHNVLLKVELEEKIKNLFDGMILLFDEDEHLIEARMK